MTDYNAIPDSDLEPGQPWTSIKALRVRDNPIAIAEGAAGAPRVRNAALAQYPWGAEDFQTGNSERDWVLGRTANANLEAVGTYAMLYATSSAPNPVNPGDNIAGSALRYAGASSEDDTNGTGESNGNSTRSPNGTWKCMGFAIVASKADSGVHEYRTTLWLRIS